MSSIILCRGVLYDSLKFKANARFLSSSPKEYSFTISYLINSCGLSPESACKASKYVKFENPDKPDSVIEFFKNHGFSQTQILNLVKSQPMLLLADPQRSILPKVEFFKSKGVSESDVADLFSKHPAIMKSRLERQIIPAFRLIRDVFQCDEVVLSAAKRYMAIFTRKIVDTLLPNIKVLRECGVPEDIIRVWFKAQPRTFLHSTEVLENSVNEVKAKGFDPSKTTFLIAVSVMSQLGEMGWQQKVDLYKKWGWSEELIHRVFRRYPSFMMTSEDKINAVMEFILNTLEWDSLVIVKFPQIMNLNLEKRVFPRGSVIKVLMSKGLIKNKFTMRAFFGLSEMLFMEKYVKPFEKEVPELVEIYKGKVGLSGTCATTRT